MTEEKRRTAEALVEARQRILVGLDDYALTARADRP